MTQKKLLKDYAKKRNFKKTTEPAGGRKRTKKDELIFVVQEHHARRLHYDFRLELDGVLKSWAVPKGPSLDPKERRLAVQTEDHPLEYASFHGTIPKGEYGGGEVFIWDHGTWSTDEIDPIKALKKGRLEFSLVGKKLKGKWILIRTKQNWLLIKRHDIKEESTQMDSWPGFIRPQLPKLVTTPPTEENRWIHEMKFDGYRMQAHLKDGIVNLFTRSGLNWSNSFPFILSSLGKLKVHNAIVDGEICALDEKGHSHFQRLQNSIKTKDDKHLMYYIFDLLFLDGKDLRALPLLERKSLLEQLLKAHPKNLAFSEHFMEQAQDFYQTSCEMQLEGIISKLADSPYRSGRNDLWLKTKCGARQEFVIGGWSDPQGGREGLGALLLGVYEGNDLRYAGRVGTGFNQKDLREIKKTLKSLEIKNSPFDLKSPKSKNIHWARPEKVCEVSFSQWTDEGSLRSAVFQGMRLDKSAKLVIHEQVNSKEITSPEKILYKKELITKKGVADFYTEIAAAMLPYLADRPLTLVRCPHGSIGSCFYQKHIAGNPPDSFNTFPINEEKGQGIYFSINSLEGLMELVQINAYEIHSWNCHWDNYMTPDQIVMDFDPGPGVKWSEVVDAAFELKEILEDLDLKSFVKLSGGKGLHIHIPIARLYSWEQVKSFSQGLALELVSRDPKRYVAKMSKNLRKKKIFVDYLRNGYGSTAVVPYSLRARDISSIAMPLEWKELKKTASADEYTLKKAMTKIKRRKRDPWEEMLTLNQKIGILEPQKKKAAA